MMDMRVLLFVLAATILEASGDAIVRIALHHPSTPARIALFLAGFALLALYGTSLNLAPVEFASVTGLYVAVLFVVFQITNYALFRVLPTPAVAAGGFLIVSGGLIVALWK
jgi:small multidrug resistance family-3 protein